MQELVEEILPGLYKLEIPLPRNPLKSLNSYILLGQERNLVIDTGMNREECSKAMKEGLKQLEVDLHKTDFFITHMHSDHSGLIPTLATPSSRLFSSEEDAVLLNAGDRLWKAMHVFIQTGGFPREAFSKAIQSHPGYKYRPLGEIQFTHLKEGDTLEVGDYVLTCVKTPGHTRGHLCLYDARKKIFFAGDHILRDITPNISLWSYQFDPLSDYLKSLDKVYAYDIDRVLPAHRKLFSDYRERITELKNHHRLRAAEVMEILKIKGPINAYQVASYMTWDIDCATFEEFPIAQKWFATGEALAHLKYLEAGGEIDKKEVEGINVFLSRPNGLICNN